MQKRTLNEGRTTQPKTEAAKRRRFQLWRDLLHDERRRHQLIFMSSVISLAAVSLLAIFVERFPTLGLDLATTRELQEISSQPFLRLMIFVSLFGYMPWSAITVACGALLVGALLGWKDGLYLLVLTALQGLANAGLKAAIGRPRPLDSLVNVFVPVSGNSFPSGHVMFYTVFFGFLMFLILARLPHNIWRIVLLVPPALLILLVGPSRMFLGAHWLSDVIAAHLLGLIILAFGIEFYLRYLAPPNPTPQGEIGSARPDGGIR